MASYSRAFLNIRLTSLVQRTTSGKHVMKTTTTRTTSTTTTMSRFLSSRDARSSTISSPATEQMRIEAEEEMKKVVELYNMQTRLSNTPTLLSTPEATINWIHENQIETLLFDCDGVIYRSPDEAPGARRCIESLVNANKNVFFVTNNAASNRQQLRDKLTKILNVDDNLLTLDMMISSSYSCAQYLKQKLLDQPKDTTGKLYVIGSEGLCDELRQTGFDVTTSNQDAFFSMSRDELADYDFSQHSPIDAVVIGHDTEFNFRKMCIANVLLQTNPQAMLVATNEDAFDLVGSDARHIPGNGSLVKSIEYCSKRTAINVGKPSKTLFDLIASKYGIDPSKSVIVGDRLDTDIRFGIESGMYSALVMTGVTTTEMLQNLKEGTVEEPLPSIILPHVGFMDLSS